jgi:hypothetical protein
VYNGSLTVAGSVVSGNRAGKGGGGLYTYFGSAAVTGSVISGNAAGKGGGVYAHYGDVEVADSVVSGNAARADGGGLFGLYGNLTVTGSTVSGNTAGRSGGGLYAYVNATVAGSTVSGNAAAASGGGIFADYGLAVTDSAVTGNAAAAGGGLFLSDDVTAATLINVTVSGNTARSGGGLFAAMAEGGVATLLNATVTRNSARDGGGLFQQSGTVRLKNTIVAQNATAAAGGGRADGHAAGSFPAGADVRGTFVSLGHNLIGVNAGAAVSFPAGNPNANGDLVGTAAAPLDPRLGPLARNGGPTRNHALLPGSPALDAGDDGGAPPTDQRGVSRPQGPHVDIGAFERT